MADLGKLLVAFGLLMLVAGLVLMALCRVNVPIGRLPGDIVYRSKNTTVYFPPVTSILLSVVLSGVFYLINHFRR